MWFRFKFFLLGEVDRRIEGLGGDAEGGVSGQWSQKVFDGDAFGDFVAWCGCAEFKVLCLDLLVE